MSWSRYITFKLIEEWKCHACLWDMDCEDYRNKVMRENAYTEIAEVCGRTVQEVKDKMHSLRSQMSGEEHS